MVRTISDRCGEDVISVTTALAAFFIVVLSLSLVMGVVSQVRNRGLAFRHPVPGREPGSTAQP
jgi:hypothetical protein